MYTHTCWLLAYSSHRMRKRIITDLHAEVSDGERSAHSAKNARSAAAAAADVAPSFSPMARSSAFSSTEWPHVGSPLATAVAAADLFLSGRELLAPLLRPLSTVRKWLGKPEPVAAADGTAATEREDAGLQALGLSPRGSSAVQVPALRELSDKPARFREFARQRARQLLLGDPSRSLRAAVATEMAKPVRVQLKDKVAFTLGVLNLCATEYVLLVRPQHFWVWYSCWVAPLLALRYATYSKKRWQFFLLDFCYLSQLLCLLHIVFPSGAYLFETVFMIANGPVAMAVIAWRNALVFHDLDKVTSAFIHAMPPLLTYCQRWYYPGALAGRPEKLPLYLSCVRGGSSASTIGSWELGPSVSSRHMAEQWYSTCDRSYWAMMAGPLLVYLLWQAAYFWYTEIHLGWRLRADPQLQTSLRYLAKARGGVLYSTTLAAARKLRIMGPHEHFDASSLRTKVCFMVAQLIYTLLTLLPTKLMYDHWWLHTAYLSIVGLTAVWNGSVYYIEVFARKYGLRAVVTPVATPTSALQGAAGLPSPSPSPSPPPTPVMDSTAATSQPLPASPASSPPLSEPSASPAASAAAGDPPIPPAAAPLLGEAGLTDEEIEMRFATGAAADENGSGVHTPGSRHDDWHAQDEGEIEAQVLGM